MITFVYDAATTGLPLTNSHPPIHTADGDIASLEFAIHGIGPLFSVELIK